MAKHEHPLARALRSKIGRVCHFTHPDTGEVIEGVYRRGRKVVRVVGMSRITDQAGGGRGFNVDEQTFTVPRHIKITFGPKGGAK